MKLTESWTLLSDEWKKTRDRFSERHIHDLRVATRRMIASLEIASAVSRNRKTHHLIRRFKKLLKRLGPLREVQVHLLKSEMGNSEIARQFSEFLKRQEKEEILRLRRRMQERTRKTLRRNVQATNRNLEHFLERSAPAECRAAIEASVAKRFDAVLVADRCFRQSRTMEDFHRLRIQFKRFRYAAEAAKPVIGSFTNRQLDGMRKLQQRMGEIHDLQTYMTALAEWAGRKPPSDLQNEFNRRMKAFIKRPDRFEAFRYLS